MNRFVICLRVIPSLTLSRQMAAIQNPLMGGATKNAKVVAIALGTLQRLIALRAVSLSAIPAIIQTMNDCMSQGVDIQLKILQILLSPITTIHDKLLAGVRTFLLSSSLTDGLTRIRCEIGPFKLHGSRTAVVSPTRAATLRHVHHRQGRRGRSSHARLSVTMTQALRPTAQGAFAIFEGGERPRFIQLERLHKTFVALELITSVLTNYNQLFCKVCLSSFLPIRDLYASSCLQITLMFTAFRALTLITTPPFRLAPQNALRALRFPACPPRHPSCPPLAQAVLLRARGGRRSQPQILIKQASNSLAVSIPVSLSLGGRGCPRWRSCAGKTPLYTSFLTHRLTGDFVPMSGSWTVSAALLHDA